MNPIKAVGSLSPALRGGAAQGSQLLREGLGERQIQAGPWVPASRNPLSRVRIWEVLRSYGLTRVRDLGQCSPEQGFVLRRPGVTQSHACCFTAAFLRDMVLRVS